MMKKISIKQGLWFKNRHIDLTFPAKWEVENCRMQADKWKKLIDRQINKALDNPIGCKRLEDLARGKREVAILFDDMARPTRPERIIPFLLERLFSAGIRKENIRFIMSSGSHGAHRADDFRKKLGRDIVANFPVYNHNCFENCKYVGKTATGVPLYVNKEFLLCDLKIGIGTVLPHIYCGFSGGGKILLPGICGIRTIERFHALQVKNNRNGNLRMRTISEAVELTGFQFKIDFIVNSRAEEVAIFAGEPSVELRQAIKVAGRAYKTAHKKNYDVVIANAFAKSNEADLAIHNVIKVLNPKKGILVLAADNPQGQINHYLFRSCGKFIAGRQFKIRTFLNPAIKYIFFSRHKEYGAFDTFDNPNALIWKKSWSEVLRIIKLDFSRPRVAVFGDATIQLIK